MEKNVQYTKLLQEQIMSVGRETMYLEFKSNYVDSEKLGEYISALSNGACLDNQDYGYLYFGVEDGTLAVKGTSFDISKMKAKGNQSLEIYLRQHISPKINFIVEKFLYNNTIPIVMFRIPAAVNEPTTYFGKPFIRVDSHVTELTRYADWMRSIYMSRTDWSAEIISGATIDDLDVDAIKLAREGIVFVSQILRPLQRNGKTACFWIKPGLHGTEKSPGLLCCWQASRSLPINWVT